MWSLLSRLLARSIPDLRDGRVADAIAPSIQRSRLQILSETGDEAGLALGVGQALAYGGQKVQEAMGSRLLTGGLPVAAFALIASLVVNLDGIANLLPPFLVQGFMPWVEGADLLITMGRLLALLAIVGLLVAHAGAMATGWETSGLPIGHVRISIAPVGQHPVVMLMPHHAPPTFPWRHSARRLGIEQDQLRHTQLMERPDAIADIVSAIPQPAAWTSIHALTPHRERPAC